MAVSELDATPVPVLTDLHRALVGRATRKQQVAQSIVYMRFRGHSTQQIRDHLGIDEDWMTRGEGLIFEAQEALDEELGEGWDLLVGQRPLEMPVGRLISKMAEIMADRVRHAEAILMLRAGGWRHNAEIRAQIGIGEEAFKVADRWLKDAGLELREE